MPLADSPWTLGKCSLKLLQSLAAALPVVASPVGMNADVLKHGQIGYGARTAPEWKEALVRLNSTPGLCVELGTAGRRVVEQEYSCRIIAGRVAAHMRAALEPGRIL